MNSAKKCRGMCSAERHTPPSAHSYRVCYHHKSLLTDLVYFNEPRCLEQIIKQVVAYSQKLNNEQRLYCMLLESFLSFFQMCLLHHCTAGIVHVKRLQTMAFEELFGDVEKRDQFIVPPFELIRFQTIKYQGEKTLAILLEFDGRYVQFTDQVKVLPDPPLEELPMLESLERNLYKDFSGFDVDQFFSDNLPSS